MSKGKPRARRHSQAQVLDAARAFGCKVAGDRISCPAHGGDGLNVCVYIGDQGEARPFCFTRDDCKAEDIIAALRPHLGEPDTDVSSTRPVVERGPRQRPDALPMLPAGHSDKVAAFALRADLQRLLDAERAISGRVGVRYRIGFTTRWKARPEERFIIPIRNPAGEIITMIAHAPKSMRGPDRPGVDVDAGWPRWPLACLDGEVYSPGDLIVITEAEPDALAVRSAGVPAYGCHGAGAWNDAYAIELRDDYRATRVAVMGDRDEAGQRFNAAVIESCARAGLHARAVLLPEVIR